MEAPSPPPPPSPQAVGAEDRWDGAGNAFTDDALSAGSIGGKDAPLHFAAPKGRAPGSAAPKAPGTTTPSTTTPDASQHADAVPHRESMLIYTATLVLAVYQVDTSLTRIEELTRSLGGYLASRTDSAIVVRVPRARFQDELGEIGKVGDVLHRTIEAQDVSDQVVDLEARLKNARAVRDRIAQLLQGATATKDALAIEKELSRVMGEIEQMEGKLQLFADKIAYSTVTVTFQPIRTSDVHAMARLPFPWLEALGLGPLLQVK